MTTVETFLPGPADSPSDVLTATLEQLSNATTLPRVTEVVAHAVRLLMKADGATFVLREDDRCFYADEDAIGPMWKGLRFPMSACISGWSMLHREVVLIEDIYADDRIPHDSYRPTFVKSLCMAPIRSADPIGALGAYWSDEHTPDPQQVRQLEVLANSTAVALENLELRGAVVRRQTERDEATRRSDELDQALHIMVHDLRTPLAAIMGFAELLDEDLDDDPDSARQFARTIFSSGQRMAARMDRMLALYRVINRPIEPEVVDVSAVGRELAEHFSTDYGGQPRRIVVEDGLAAVADPELVRVLLENLIGNAAKYTGKVSDPMIRVGRLPTDGSDTEEYTTFFVRDNGAGFDQMHAGRLFRPMTRLHSEDEFPGTGLGLASVARIVALHGGSVRAEGEKSVGATFYFALPTPPRDG